MRTNYYLTYHGKGCGGVGIPFPYLQHALNYAAERYALTAKILAPDGQTHYFSRPDCRFTLRPHRPDALPR